MELLYTISNKDYTVGLVVRRSVINHKLVVVECPPIMMKVAMGKEINALLTQLTVWGMIDSLTVKLTKIDGLIDWFSKLEGMLYNPLGKVVHDKYTPLILRKDVQIERLNIRKNYHPLNPLGMDLPAKQINKPESAYYKKIFKLEL